jgi:Zn-finger nucleic acid-binding protein
VFDSGGFEAMNYCPFCGAKFPERLDGELSKILQTEYGLESWKEYKKAPKEFKTDEWWKKRGL